jgi:hypothetical protein
MRNYYTAPRFDEHAFDGYKNLNHPVSVRYMGLDRWESPGLTFLKEHLLERQCTWRNSRDAA